MSCKKCQQKKPCTTTNDCACEVYLTSDCINNVKAEFECLNISNGLSLTETLEAMDEQICIKLDTITNYFTLINIGSGAEVYKGVNNLGQKELRTIVKEGDLVTVEEGENTIIIGIDEEALNTFIETNQKTVVVSNAGTIGETLVNTAEVSGDTTTYPIKRLIHSDQDGEGESFVRDLQVNTDDLTLRTKKIKTDGSLVVTSNEKEIIIRVPTNLSDIKFYVNQQYTGGNEDGSLARPYTNLYDAFEAFKGTGTILQPQYGGVASIELLNDVEVLSTGAKAMTYVSINKLKVKGNGFRIIYKGTQDYFLSTEYLVGLDAKSDSGKLDNNIYMEFENTIIQSDTRHKIISHLNYKSPSVSTTQNTSEISFNNCEIIDNSHIEDIASYLDTGVDLFGFSVFAQNSLDKNLYMVKNKDVNWTGEGSFTMNSCKLTGSSSTIVHNLNSSLNWYDIDINFNSLYVNYEDITVDVYNPIVGVYFILNENNGLSGRATNYIRIEDIKETSQEASSGGSFVGGVDAFCKVVGSGTTIFFGGSFYSEKVNNLIQLHNTTSYATLTNVNALSVEIADATYGAFKYTGTIPGSAKYIDVNLSIINDVRNWTTLQYIRPTAASATINGAYFSDKPDFPDNAAAIAGGLVPGNEYYDTTGQIATRVV